MRSPSDNLLHLLTDMQLCSRQDVAACEKDVQRLCQELPDFDSVWLDTLVQQRKLTRWQADQLQSGDSQRVKIGEFIRQDALGDHTFLAYSSVTLHSAVLLHIPTGQPLQSSLPLNRLLGLVERLDEVRETAPQSVVLPKRVVEASNEAEMPDSVGPVLSGGAAEQYFLASEYVAGWSAEELLIRAGRIPWQMVSEIAQELLTALCWLEDNGLVHGDIALRNIRAGRDGRVSLVAPFAARLVHPTVSFTDKLKLRDIETVAPELVGSGASADSRSDLYALGCVLWQMLTARPPFLAADPVNRILKSQQKDVPDVRTLVPDCPEWMARLIHNLTRRTPELRPKFALDTLNAWEREAPRRQHQVRRLLKRMPDRGRQATRVSRPFFRTRTMIAAISACLVVVALVAYGSQVGLTPRTLTVNGRQAVPRPDTATVSNAPSAISSFNSSALATGAEDGLLSMPQPDSAGVVVLESNQVYHATDLEFDGVMHIEASNEAAAVVLIEPGESWRISASQIVINNIQTQYSREAPPSGETSCRGLWCTSDVLAVSDCIFSSATTSTMDCSVYWEPATGTTSVVSFTNSVLVSDGYGIWAAQPPGRCQLNNVLLQTANVGMRCNISTEKQTEARIHAYQVTQATGRGFLDVVMETVAPAELRVELVCGESVLAPSSSLVRIAGPQNWSGNTARVEFLLPERGNPTIVPPNVHPATTLDRSLKAMVALGDHQLNIESLLMAVPEFRAKTSVDDDDSLNDFTRLELIDYEGPKLSTKLPGVNVGRLPVMIDVSEKQLRF